MPPAAAVALAEPAQGWLYSLLRWFGVDPDNAAHIQNVLVRPLAVLLILVAALVIARLGSAFIRRWIGLAASKAAARADSERATARVATVTSILANVWRVIVGVVAALLALQAVGLDLTPLVAGATVVGATIGFGAQRIVLDVLSGFLLITEDQFSIGDTISVLDTTGVVEDLSLRVTQIRQADGALCFVANGEVRKVANVSRGWAKATIDIAAPASTDIDTLLETLRGAAEEVAGDPEIGRACLDLPEVLGVVASDADTVTARVAVRTSPADRVAVERALRAAATRRLQRELARAATPDPVGSPSPTTAPERGATT